MSLMTRLLGKPISMKQPFECEEVLDRIFSTSSETGWFESDLERLLRYGSAKKKDLLVRVFRLFQNGKIDLDLVSNNGIPQPGEKFTSICEPMIQLSPRENYTKLEMLLDILPECVIHWAPSDLCSRFTSEEVPIFLAIELNDTSNSLGIEDSDTRGIMPIIILGSKFPEGIPALYPVGSPCRFLHPI